MIIRNPTDHYVFWPENEEILRYLQTRPVAWSWRGEGGGFAHSVAAQLQQTGYLTERQEAALENAWREPRWTCPPPSEPDYAERHDAVVVYPPAGRELDPDYIAERQEHAASVGKLLLLKIDPIGMPVQETGMGRESRLLFLGRLRCRSPATNTSAIDRRSRRHLRTHAGTR